MVRLARQEDLQEVVRLYDSIHDLEEAGKVNTGWLGHEFLQYYEDYAREHGCKYLRLDTFAGNSAARAFYRKTARKPLLLNSSESRG